MLQRFSTILVAGWMAIVPSGCSRRASASGNPNSELRDKMAEGITLYTQGKYLAAERTFQQGYERAQQLRDTHTALRFLNSVGGARFAAFRYKEAMRVFLDT